MLQCHRAYPALTKRAEDETSGGCTTEEAVSLISGRYKSHKQGVSKPSIGKKRSRGGGDCLSDAFKKKSTQGFASAEVASHCG